MYSICSGTVRVHHPSGNFQSQGLAGRQGTAPCGNKRTSAGHKQRQCPPSQTAYPSYAAQLRTGKGRGAHLAADANLFGPFGKNQTYPAKYPDSPELLCKIPSVFTHRDRFLQPARTVVRHGAGHSRNASLPGEKGTEQQTERTPAAASEGGTSRTSHMAKRSRRGTPIPSDPPAAQVTRVASFSQEKKS